MSGGVKHDSGKAPMDLLPHEALVSVAEVLAFGEKKYSAGNWAKGIEYRRLISAAMRHLGAFNSGEDKDPESGLSHIDHAACCLLFLSYMVQKRPDLDNRWTKELVASVNEAVSALPARKQKRRLKDGGRYVRNDGITVTVKDTKESDGMPFKGSDGLWYTTGGEAPGADLRLVEEA